MKNPGQIALARVLLPTHRGATVDVQRVKYCSPPAVLHYVFVMLHSGI
jgi:hypothetical protein